MDLTIKANGISMHDAFRMAANVAVNGGGNREKLRDVGSGMTNVVVTTLGFDTIIQCYPNREHDSVCILIPTDEGTEAVELKQLPLILQMEVFKCYCKELEVDGEISNDF